MKKQHAKLKVDGKTIAEFPVHEGIQFEKEVNDADIKQVTVTIHEMTINGDVFVRMLRLIKKHEPEIWDEIKDTIFDSFDNMGEDNS